MSDPNDTKLTAAQRIAAAEARRQAKTDAEKAAREEQHANDLEAIEALEATLGQKVYPSKQVTQWKAGLPVIVGIRVPTHVEYKRQVSRLNRANGNGDAKVSAQNELANACWVYPEDQATRDEMLQVNSGLIASIGLYVNKLAEAEFTEEGKG